MAFIIPMLGKSSRFFDQGYTLPKYQLEINGSSAFSYAVSSFKRYFKSDLFIFLVRSDYFAFEFVTKEISLCGITNFKIVVIDHETDGQAGTVSMSLEYLDDNEPLYIFNIDTYRDNYIKPDIVNDCSGYLEVFKGEGSAWSFVLPGKNNSVLRTAEKDRISELCSNGLYFFKNKKIFLTAFEAALENRRKVNGEYYIAPIYNELIGLGYNIKYQVVDIGELVFFGTPEEYMKAIRSK